MIRLRRHSSPEGENVGGRCRRRAHGVGSRLPRAIRAALALPVVALAAAVGLGSVRAAPAGPGTWSSRAEIVASWEQVRPRDGSALARVAGLPDSTSAIELRPEVTWEFARVSLTAKPRVLATAAGGEQDVVSQLDEGWLRVRPRAGVSLQAGREVLLWGPATFWNPSNPFFAENNRANPQRALGGIDLARVRWQFNRAWSATAIGQFGRGRADVASAHRQGVKVDWVGEAASAAFVAASAPHERASVHGWAQGTVSDAVIVYGEAGWSEGAASLYPERGPSPTGWSLQPRGGDARRLKAIVGGAYTLLSGATVTVEVWRNGDAWGADRRGQVAEALRALVRQPFGIADGQIGGILTTLPEPYGRHRAGVQLANAGDVRTAWLVRYTHGIDEGGGEWLGYLRRDLSDSLQVWGSAAWRTGGERSAYGLGVRSAVSVGLTWMPW